MVQPMTNPTKHVNEQPTPRERPDDYDTSEPPREHVAPSQPARRRRRGEPEPEGPPRAEPPEMGIGLDERGEIDRRFEP